MSAPAPSPKTGHPQGRRPEELDVCDRCLALSQLTVTLAKVPRVRLEIPMTEPEDGTDPVPIVFAAPLVPRDDGLAPLPGELVRAVEEVTVQRALTIRHDLRDWTADAVRERTRQAGLTAWCSCSPSYPPCLLELSDPPPVLYVRGDPQVLLACPGRSIAMVGTRHPTAVGRDAARRIASGIAHSGGLVVSGMALGVDAASHEGALAVGGRTVAVLASGADRASPPSNGRLYDRILDAGAVVSELPPGMPPNRWTFPARNRIIAALSQATVVVEAPRRSGALITAEQAQDIGRDVYAVPGSLANEQCEGTNRLLADGAGAVIDGTALASLLEMGRTHGPVVPRDGPLAEVHQALVRAPLSVSELTARIATSMGPGEVELVLLDLELAGWISRRPDGRYGVVTTWVPA